MLQHTQSSKCDIPHLKDKGKTDLEMKGNKWGSGTERGGEGREGELHCAHVVLFGRASALDVERVRVASPTEGLTDLSQ